MSSAALGGKVTSVSDDFFAGAHHLLLVEVMSPTSSRIHSLSPTQVTINLNVAGTKLEGAVRPKRRTFQRLGKPTT